MEGVGSMHGLGLQGAQPQDVLLTFALVLAAYAAAAALWWVSARTRRRPGR
jgi:hypothetical protein